MHDTSMQLIAMIDCCSVMTSCILWGEHSDRKSFRNYSITFNELFNLLNPPAQIGKDSHAIYQAHTRSMVTFHTHRNLRQPYVLCTFCRGDNYFLK